MNAIWASPYANGAVSSFLATLAARWASANHRRRVVLDPESGWAVPYRDYFQNKISLVSMNELDGQPDLSDNDLILSADPNLPRLASRVIFSRVGIAFTRRLPALASAQKLRDALAEAGVPRSRILPILMEERGPGLAPIDMIEESWGPIAHKIPIPPAAAAESELAGRPLNASAAFENLLSEFSAKKSSTAPSPGSALKKSMERSIFVRLQTRWAEQDNPPAEKKMKEETARECTEFFEGSGWGEMPEADRKELLENVWNRIAGLGPLEPLFAAPGVSEIMINQGKKVFVEQDGHLSERTDLVLENDDLVFIIEKILAFSGRRADQSHPMADIRLSDGSRANLVLPPVSLDGPSLTIRRFRPHFLEMADLLRQNSLNKDQAAVLMNLVQTRKNLIIAGNTGAGKTTLLNILATFVDPSERILTLEDTAELQLKKPHVIRLETRTKNLEGQGAVTMADLVVNALRMRPDRLIVGEVRGGEVIPMLQAMNTGHSGSMTTVHANSAEDAVKRLESMILVGAPSWPLDVVRSQIAAGFDAVVFLQRENGRRRVKEIAELDYSGGAFCLKPLC